MSEVLDKGFFEADWSLTIPEYCDIFTLRCRPTKDTPTHSVTDAKLEPPIYMTGGVGVGGRVHHTKDEDLIDTADSRLSLHPDVSADSALCLCERACVCLCVYRRSKFAVSVPVKLRPSTFY